MRLPLAPIAEMPRLGTGKQAGPEDKLWRELMLAYHGTNGANVWLGPSPAWRRYARIAAWAGMGSDNWPPMAAAAWYIAEPDWLNAEGLTARELWLRVSTWMCGGDGAPGDLGLFCASEPLSPTYDGFTLGAWAAVLRAARRRGDHEVASAIEWLFTRWTAAAAMISGPPAREVRLVTPNGEERIRAKGTSLPATLGIGARGNTAHAMADVRSMFLAEILGFDWSHKWPGRKPWEYWFLQLAGELRGDFGVPVRVQDAARAALSGDPGLTGPARDALAEALAGTRWKAFEVRLYPDRLVGLMSSCPNGNSGWVPASIAMLDGSSVTWFYPWTRPKPKSVGSGVAGIEDRVLRVASSEGVLPAVEIPGEMVGRWVFDGDGCRSEEV